MANCGNNRNCGYGALNSVYRCGCNQSCGSQCGWNPCRYGCCGDSTCPYSSTEHPYGLFVTAGDVAAAAGSSVLFTAAQANEEYYIVSNGNIVIRKPGVYHALYTANIPSGHAAATTVSLGLNGAALANTGVDIRTANNATTNNYASMTLFTANAGDALNLSTLNALNIPACSMNPIFTLALIKMA